MSHTRISYVAALTSSSCPLGNPRRASSLSALPVSHVGTTQSSTRVPFSRRSRTRTGFESEPPRRDKGTPAKIFVVGSAELIQDSVLEAEGRTPNSMFIMNVIDYLNDRVDVALMRSKEQRFNPLENPAPATKTLTKAFNIAGLPVLVVLFGIAVWLRRVARKKRIQAMFQET